MHVRCAASPVILLLHTDQEDDDCFSSSSLSLSPPPLKGRRLLFSLLRRVVGAAPPKRTRPDRAKQWYNLLHKQKRGRRQVRFRFAGSLRKFVHLGSRPKRTSTTHNHNNRNKTRSNPHQPASPSNLTQQTEERSSTSTVDRLDKNSNAHPPSQQTNKNSDCCSFQSTPVTTTSPIKLQHYRRVECHLGDLEEDEPSLDCFLFETTSAPEGLPFESFVRQGSAQIPIPEEISVMMSEELFDCDRIQVAVRFCPLQPRNDINHPDYDPTARNSSSSTSPTSSSRRRKKQAEDLRAWSIENGNTIVQKGMGRRAPGKGLFTMDSVFDEFTTTETVYQETSQSIISAVASGRHGTIFAYGQTGSGKTYTMQGSSGDAKSGQGLIHFAMEDLFETMELSRRRKWKVTVQYFEIYNEEVRDLIAISEAEDPTKVLNSSLRSLRSNSSDSLTKPQRSNSKTGNLGEHNLPSLKIHETRDGNIFVDAHESEVANVQECIDILNQGNQRRSWAATDSNSHSSRSHAIFRLTLRTTPLDADDVSRVSVLNLVDLAGSENSRAANSSGSRKREGGKINQSLLALSRVIHSLSLPERKRPGYIGYRDSKLTRILQPSLSGNACMAILCCASMAKSNIDETRSTLKFASSAKLIQIQPVVNEVVDKKQSLEDLQEELAEVRRTLREFQVRYAQEMLEHHEPQSSVFSVSRIQTDSTANSDDDDMTEDVSSAHLHEGIPEEHHSLAILDESDVYVPPVKEVVLGKSNPMPLPRGKHKARLTQRIETTEMNVQQLHHDLRDALTEVERAHQHNSQLNKQVYELQEEALSRALTSQAISSWYFLMCIFLYGFGLQELFICALIFLWLSMQVVK